MLCCGVLGGLPRPSVWQCATFPWSGPALGLGHTLLHCTVCSEAALITASDSSSSLNSSFPQILWEVVEYSVGMGLDEWQLCLRVGGSSYKPVFGVLVQPGSGVWKLGRHGAAFHNSCLLLTNQRALCALVSCTHCWQGGCWSSLGVRSGGG